MNRDPIPTIGTNPKIRTMRQTILADKIHLIIFFLTSQVLTFL